MERKKEKQKKFLTMRSSVKTLAIKCYEEQMPLGWEDVQKRIRSYPKSELQILGICHNRDPKTDDVWAPSMEKPHYHIIVRIVAPPFEKSNPMCVSTILNILGIVYRPDKDEDLWKEHGVESCWDYSEYAVYLTHETKKAVMEGKTRYEIEEYVSNLTLEEIKQVRDGYMRLSETNGKVCVSTMAKLDQNAYELGQNLGDFDKWYGDLPFAVRCNTKMSTVAKSYYRGVEDRVKHGNREVTRICIFIQGKPNIGKTYAAKKALAGKYVLEIAGGGTGKFDTLTPAHEAIILDDTTCGNLLNLTDNYFCQTYKRNNNNPYWCGEWFVVTSNLTFEEFLRTCNISQEHFDAMRSRFFVCHVENHDGKNYLICDSSCKRGSVEERQYRKEKYMQFRDIYNETLQSYKPVTGEVDFDDLNDYDFMKPKDAPKKTAKEIKAEKLAKLKDQAEETYFQQFPTIEKISGSDDEREILETFFRVYPEYDGLFTEEEKEAMKTYHCFT